MLNLWRMRFLTSRRYKTRKTRRSRRKACSHRPAAIQQLEDRTLLAAQTVDLGPLRFYGEFVQVGDTYTITDDVQLGLVPNGADPFQPLLGFEFENGGELTFVTGASDPSFTVHNATMSSIVQSSPTGMVLWSTDGAFSFDADALAGSGVQLSSGTAQPFSLFGGEMSASSIQLTNPGSTAGADVLVGGQWVISPQGDITIEMGGANPAVRINRSGLSVPDFQTSLPTTFTALDLTFTPTNVTLGYTSQDQTFSLWGVATVSSADNGLSNLNADLGTSGSPNFTIINGGISDFAIELEGGSTEIFGLKLNSYDLTFTMDTSSGQLGAYGSVHLDGPDGSMLIVGEVGTSDTPGMLLENGQITQFTFSFEGEFSIGELILKTDEATISYESGTTYGLAGTFEIPELFFAKVTFAPPHGLVIEDGHFHVDGLQIELTDVYLGAFVLDDLMVEFSDQNGVTDFEVSAKLWFPGEFWVAAMFEFVNGDLNSIGVDFKVTGADPGIAIGDTGLFLIGMGAEIQNLTDPHNLVVSGMVSLSYGPTESFTVFGKTEQATLLQLVGTFSGDRHGFTAEVDAYIGAFALGNSTSGLFGEAKAALDINWSEGTYIIEVEGGYYDGTFKGKLVGDFQSDLFAVFADLEVDIPDAVPFIGGDTLGSVDFALLDVFGHPDQSFFAAWTKINLLIHTFDIGFEYTFDGDFSLISGSKIDAIEHEVDNPSPQVYHYKATFVPPNGATHATFVVNWGEDAGDQKIAILPPGADSPIPASDFSSYQQAGNFGLTTVPQFTTDTSTAVHIVGLVGVPESPLLPGPYQLILTSNYELTPTWSSIFGYTAPTVTLGTLTDTTPSDSPVNVPVAVTIEPTFYEQGRVTLYVDTEPGGYGGRPVKGATNVPIPPVSQGEYWNIPWDLSDLNSQPYYLYATINDGFNATVYSEYIGPFTPSPPIGGVVKDPLHGNVVSGVTVYLDLNGNGQYDAGVDPQDITNQDGHYAFFNLSPLPGMNDYTVGVVVPPGFQLHPGTSELVHVEYVGNPLVVDFQIDEFASINGVVFVDANQNGTYESGDPLLSGWTIYLDANNNRRLDAGELRSRTNSQGAYAFYNLNTNTSYTVRRVLQPNYYDIWEADSYTVSIGSDEFQKVTGLDFGVLPFSSVSGNIAGHPLQNGTLNPDATPLEGWTVIVTEQTAINAGGSAAGVYVGDEGFQGGQDSSSDESINTGLIDDPAPQAVYQSYRYGKDFTYQVSGLTTNLPYQVRLDFAELYWDSPGDRIFNVIINGETVLENFDIVAAAQAQGQGNGQYVALERTFTALPSGPNGDTITIQFQAVKDNAAISGITVTALTTSQAVNAGGVADGSFKPDGQFSGGQVAPPSTSSIDTTGVTAPAPQEVYQTNRYDKQFTYTLNGQIPGARYAVRLHFAETYWTAPGQRVFDVLINGEPVLVDFDIFAAAGGQNTAIVQTFGALAQADSGGSIVIEFIASVDNAQINGIEIVGGTASGVTDADGNYSVGGLRDGNYTVSQVVPPGWREVSPFTSDLVMNTPSGSDIQSVPGGVTAARPAIGDFDNDGKLDFAVIDGNGSNILVYHNGNLDNPSSYPLNVPAVAITAADLFGTGRAGIAILDEFGEISYLRNDGPGYGLYFIGTVFDLGVAFEDQLTVVGMASGNFMPDDKGQDQLAVTYFAAPQNGLPTWSVAVFGYLDGATQSDTIYQQYSEQPPQSMAVGDINRDGFDDVVISPANGSPLIIFGNAINQVVSLEAMSGFGQIGVGDINNDGLLDVAVIDEDGALYYAIQSSSGLFPLAATTAYWNPVNSVHGLLLQDINGDLLADLIALVDGGFDVSVVTQLNSGKDGEWFNLNDSSGMTLPQMTEGGRAFVAADLDADALPDLIVVGSSAGVAEVVRNRSVTVPTSLVTKAIGTDATGLNFVNAQIGQINGRSFDDVTRSGNPGLAQPGRGGETVYLDLNRNGRLDSGEPSTQSSATGDYAFNNLAPGTYLVRLLVPEGRRLSHPHMEGYEVVVGPGSTPVFDAHFGTMVALDVTWTIPDTGTADWTIVRNGDRIEVLDAWAGVVAWERLENIESITIIGAQGRVNKLTIDMTAGVFAPRGGITFQGTEADDQLSVRLGLDNDQVIVNDNSAAINALNLSWTTIALLHIAAGDGANQFEVSGQPVTPKGVVELGGGTDNDTYNLATLETQIRLTDAGGVDTIDFHRSSAGKHLRLGSTNGRWQSIDRLGNRIALEGVIENVVGTEYADTLIGNDSANMLMGLGGADELHGMGGDDLLFGGEGDDTLRGSAGRDIIVGGAGNDRLIGAEGDDLLIGGVDRDRIYGQSGDDLLIGVSTTFDEDAAALAALFAEWTSGRSYEHRIANLTNGSGSPIRANGDVFLDRTSLIEDRAGDRLQGGQGRDWFIIGKEGKAQDRRPEEVVTIVGQSQPPQPHPPKPSQPKPHPPKPRPSKPALPKPGGQHRPTPKPKLPVDHVPVQKTKSPAPPVTPKPRQPAQVAPPTSGKITGLQKLQKLRSILRGKAR